jgi:hypothetical protein
MENDFHIFARGDGLSEKMRRFQPYTARKIIILFEQTNKTRLLKQFQYAKLRHKTESSYQVWQEGLHSQQIIGGGLTPKYVIIIAFSSTHSLTPSLLREKAPAARKEDKVPPCSLVFKQIGRDLGWV